jgi:hypothetical protein
VALDLLYVQLGAAAFAALGALLMLVPVQTSLVICVQRVSVCGIHRRFAMASSSTRVRSERLTWAGPFRGTPSSTTPARNSSEDASCAARGLGAGPHH